MFLLKTPLINNQTGQKVAVTANFFLTKLRLRKTKMMTLSIQPFPQMLLRGRSCRGSPFVNSTHSHTYQDP